MDTDLRSVTAALGGLDDDQLAALIETVNNVPQVAPG
jgi:hypothetical protein